MTRDGGDDLLTGGTAALTALSARREGFTPEWELPPPDGWDAARGPGVALARVVARYLEILGHRFERSPHKHELAFLNLLGLELLPACPAAAPVAFQLQEKAPPARIPAGTRLTGTAVVQPQPVSFETIQTVGVSAAKLAEVVSLWPGRDQYIDHSPAVVDGRPFAPFRRADLVNTPHALYMAHDTLLALSGEVNLLVGIELATAGNRELNWVWEYWDGKVWRHFQDFAPDGSSDGTDGLTRTGPVLLKTAFAETAPTVVNGVTSSWVRARLDTPLPADSARESADRAADASRVLPDIDVIELSVQIKRPLPPVPPPPPPLQFVALAAAQIATPSGTDQGLAGKAVLDKGLPLEKAFADQLQLDVTKTFYPFGVQPLPGAAFYFAADEVMAKPGAVVTLEFRPALTPQQMAADKLTPTPSSESPVLVWEYWDGARWSPLGDVTRLDANDQKWYELFQPDADKAFRVQFRVPPDAAPKRVNEVPARWLRVRFVSGAFGRVYTVVIDPTTTPPKTSSMFIPVPPALADVRYGYTWQYGPYPPQRTFTFNDFGYEDHTEDALWEGRTFVPFRPSAESLPALYLGFDQPLPAEYVGVYFDVRESPSGDPGPALAWEYWNGNTWAELTAADHTRRLRVPGLVMLVHPPDTAALARFGTPRYWVRARLREDDPPGDVTLLGVYPHAVACEQRATVTDEVLGVGDGRPGLSLAFRRVPVLPGEWVEVREVNGPRAAVEWRTIARALDPAGGRLVSELEALLAAESDAAEVIAGPVRLRRDRLKRVTEVWVRWAVKADLSHSGPEDRHFLVSRADGVVRFGDGQRGKVPPAAATVLARRYQFGGGAFGNVPAGAITQVVGAIGGLERVRNVRAAEGGADGETPEQARRRGPAFVRHGGRSVGLADYEALAREAAPSLARVWARANRDAADRTAPQPGGVTLHVIPNSLDPQPQPSFGLREEIREYIRRRCPACLAAADRVRVVGVSYHPIDVIAVLVPEAADQTGPVLDRVRTAVERFLHPVGGGPDGRGWAPGRPVYAGKLAAVLERVAGVDRVNSLTLSVGGVPQPDPVAVPSGHVVAAGDIDLRTAAPGGGGR